MYTKKHKKPKTFDYDLVVIGSGAGGGVAAHTAAEMGKKVALVEDKSIGGECANFGCLPTKALIHAANEFEHAKTASQFGIHASSVTYNYASLKAWKDKAVSKTNAGDDPKAFAHEHIKFIHGHAHFISPWTVTLGTERLSARNFLIATGSHVTPPLVAGLKEAGYITYRDAVNRTSLPKSLLVIGGGGTGCEFTHLFSSLGSKVYLVEQEDKLLPDEDPEVGSLLEALFESRGVRVHTSSKITSIKVEGTKKVVYFEKGNKRSHIAVDEILLASGRTANTDLGLHNAGVTFNSRRVKTNAFMQTSVEHIYAAGDVTGPYNFTHMAIYQSRLAAHNMFAKKKIAANYHAVPRCTFIEPEVACVGATEAELEHLKIAYHKATSPINVIARSHTSNQDVGFVKILTSHTGIIIGASIVAPRAGEMLQELTLAIHKKLKARDVANTLHAFPTWSEAIRVCASKINC